MIELSWDAIKERYAELNTQLSDPSLDSSKRNKLQKEHAFLSSILDKKNSVDLLDTKIKDTKEAAIESEDEEFAELCNEEVSDLEAQRIQIFSELNDLAFPPPKHDNRSVYLEIRGGAGGQEAALFAADLMRMYTNYALSRGWKVFVESSSSTDLGGFREVVLYIKGKNAYGHLKHESGVHRVQRVPATEGSGRVHTSTATVAVLPEAKEVDVDINPNDLRIDVYRASGAGGQHVNTTDSAVRITHVPTGVVVACQDERSQHKNKAKAMKILQSRLLAHQVEKQASERSEKRKEQVGTGMRAEKVRTYNFPQNRVTDHQVDVTLKNLDKVILGDLDEIIQQLRKKDNRDRQKHPLLS